MKLVSSERTKYGANRTALEHLGNNVTDYKVNLTVSKSQLRDLELKRFSNY